MYTLYVLYSLKDEGLYVGQTANFEERLRQHNSGKVKSTKDRAPFEVAHLEFLPKEVDAVEREKFLKSLWGAREKKRILKKFLKTRSSKT